MPWIAVVVLCLVGACRFEADYSGGGFRCGPDDDCPAGLVCRTDLDPRICTKEPQDAALDMLVDDVRRDMPEPALTCADPGMLTNDQAVSGSTANRQPLMSSFCGGGVQNAKDAVYTITTTAPNQQLTVFITNSSLTAYVLNTCSATASCLTGNVASSGSPLAVTAAAAGPYWIVVDNLQANLTDAYTLRVRVQ